MRSKSDIRSQTATEDAFHLLLLQALHQIASRKRASEMTPYNHQIWTFCINQHETLRRYQLDVIQKLQHLLQEWSNLKTIHNTPGPYISPIEQVKYVEAIQTIWQPIYAAILELKFEPCFTVNNMGIPARNRQSFVVHCTLC